MQIAVVTPREGDAAVVLPALGVVDHPATVLPAGVAALDHLNEPGGHADVIVLDARDDLAAARRLCGLLASHPVLVVVPESALGALGHDWGFADFVVEPVAAAELDARLRILAGPAASPSAGPVQVDEQGYRATLAGRPLDLTYTEFELLKFLVANPRRVHTREVLLTEVWGYDYIGGTRTVDVHVRRLRAKFGSEFESLIETVRNVGYRYQPRT